MTRALLQPSGSEIESLLLWQMRHAGLPMPEREYRFAPPRRFRADFAWPAHKLLVECDGAIWSGGRHTRPQGFIKDQEKTNLAALLGWRMLRFSREAVEDLSALSLIERALEMR